MKSFISNGVCIVKKPHARVISASPAELRQRRVWGAEAWKRVAPLSFVAATIVFQIIVVTVAIGGTPPYLPK
jgi:hypothetical protein